MDYIWYLEYSILFLKVIFFSQTTTAIGLSQKCSSQKKKDALKLTEWVSAKIQELYSCASHNDTIEEALLALKIN